MCVWRVPDVPNRLLLSLVRRAVGARLANAILKTARVVQRGGGAGRLRLDVFVRAEDRREVMHKLSDARPRWHVREHHPWGDAHRGEKRRQGKPMPVRAPAAAPAASAAGPAAGRRVRLATWNVW